MSAQHPLRPYYQPADESEAFVVSVPRLSAPRHATNGPSGPPPAGLSQRSSPPSNKYLRTDAESSTGMSSRVSVLDAAQSMLLGTALQYTSTCLAMPFEVGKLLLQIQWVPRDEVWAAYARSTLTRDRADRTALSHNEDLSPEVEDWQDERAAQRDFGAEDEELSDSDEAEAYFRDLTSQTRTSSSTLRHRLRPTDSTGYVVRSSVHDSTTGVRPDFVMPVVVRGGVWEMIKAVARGKEGWRALFKGAFTTFLLDLSTQTLQPFLSSVLSLFLPSAHSPLPLPYAPHPLRTLTVLVTSHILTGIALSPLDVVRTRLIAQSTLPAHRKYASPLDALRQILDDEGGWRATYLHPNLLVPAILDCTVRPLLSLATPLLIEHAVGIDPNAAPITYAFAELTLSSAALLITLPIETIRRRLQLQQRAPWGALPQVAGTYPAAAAAAKNTASATTIGVKAKPLRTCVETRPQPYAGVMEAIYRIIVEETSTLPPAKAPSNQSQVQGDNSGTMALSGVLSKAKTSSLGGLYSLYRGLHMGLGANLVVCGLTLFTRERAGSSVRWAEI